jgi:hypothetical protein
MDMFRLYYSSEDRKFVVTRVESYRSIDDYAPKLICVSKLYQNWEEAKAVCAILNLVVVEGLREVFATSIGVVSRSDLQ